MGGSSENNPSISVASNFQEQPRMWGVKNMSQIQRRALSDINHNVMGAINYRTMVTKKDVSGILVLQKDSSKQQPCLQEINKKSTGSKSGCLEEEYKDENDGGAVPMFVKHTEAMLDEIDRMEVDMEESEEPIIDIDSGNLKNPLAVVEYVDDIYASYRKLESSSCISPDYMDHQFDINGKMRAILIDWLIEVHSKFELMDETLFLTVNLIDRFLECHKVIRKKLQLVGVTAMLLACKYEEVSVPIVDDFVHITDKAYTREEVLNMEKLMVNKLQYNMSVPTPYVFMRRYLKAAEFDRKLELLSSFIIELCLVEYEMLKYPPSLLAAAAIYTAQCSLYQFKQWSKTCEIYTKYSEDQLLECSRLMVRFHQKAGAGKLSGVHRKYNTSKFGYAAKAEPAWFIL